MKPVRGRRAHPVVADAVTAAAGAAAAMAEAAGTVVVAAMVANEEAINFLTKRPLRRAFFLLRIALATEFQAWLRLSRGCHAKYSYSEPQTKELRHLCLI